MSNVNVEYVLRLVRGRRLVLRSPVSLEEFRASIVTDAGKSVPLGRIAEPEDVANLVSFLASDEATFITGQAYNENGGTLFH